MRWYARINVVVLPVKRWKSTVLGAPLEIVNHIKTGLEELGFEALSVFTRHQKEVVKSGAATVKGGRKSL